MLREKGQKVGGKKSELVDRLLGLGDVMGDVMGDVGVGVPVTASSSASSQALSLDNVPTYLPPSSVLIYACKS
ncbi:hypothetical protein TrRE_jg6300 [Triparma retinervis]|uniref:SAP domain-containing protein n=1 Tax=Triparma retinervis TaxID=2557542 RepID=A0A9W6ZC28_9STRA|nr:hypothetical protein TrRE_jg6300 [Triparma retinervis]